MKKILLGPPHITDEDVQAVAKVVKSGNLSLGEETEKFEQEMAKWLGIKYAVATSSGTTALHLAVLASGIKAGDEVITTPFSFVASTNCFLYEKAVPKFVDIDPETLNINVNKIESAISKKTKAILGVDVFGYPAEWQEIIKIANKYHLQIIEDAAEALGAKYYGKKLGSLGQPTVFAFYPNKQMTTGEGGLLTTNDQKIYELTKGLANQGRGPDIQWLRHEYLGYNYRITEMAAALGRSQLKRLDQLLALRFQAANWYKKRLSKIAGVNLLKADDQKHQRSWFVYVIKLDKNINRDQAIIKLNNKGIPAKTYLPAIHLQPYMKTYGFKPGDFPVCEAESKRTLAIPFYSRIDEKTIDYICNQLNKILK
jgi:perosamine synthetase